MPRTRDQDYNDNDDDDDDDDDDEWVGCHGQLERRRLFYFIQKSSVSLYPPKLFKSIYHSVQGTA